MGSWSRKKARKVTNTGLQLKRTAVTEELVYSTARWRIVMLRDIPVNPKRAK